MKQRRWSLLMTGENSGLVGQSGSAWNAHPIHYERVEVVDAAENEALRARLVLMQELVTAMTAAHETSRTTEWTNKPLFSRAEQIDAWEKVHRIQAALAAKGDV